MKRRHLIPTSEKLMQQLAGVFGPHSEAESALRHYFAAERLGGKPVLCFDLETGEAVCAFSMDGAGFGIAL